MPATNSQPEQRPWLLERCAIEPPSLRPDLWVPALLPDHLVLGASQAGVLWFLSLKDGQCARVVDLGGADAKDLDRLDLLDHFLLGFAPGPDHRLLAVTRDPDALTFASAFGTPAGAPEDVRKEARRHYAETTEAMNVLQWWSIDPETGQKQRIMQPGHFPERLSFSQQGQLRFLVGPDGRVHANTVGPWRDVLKGMRLDNR